MEIKRATPAIWIMGVVLGVSLSALSFFDSRPLLVWNATASAPIGLYIVEDGPWAKGDRIALRPDKQLSEELTRFRVLGPHKLLIKRAAAVAGDWVCRDGSKVSVDDVLVVKALAVSASGMPLPSWSGCRRLQGDEVFLLGDTDRSFDGRYFGIVSSRLVIGPVRFLGRSDAG